MNSVAEFFQQLTRMQWSDYLDIIIVAVILYKLFPLFRNTGTARVAGVVAAFIVIAWLTELLKLHTLSFIFDQFLQVGLLAVVVLFQPELRRMLDHLGHLKVKNLFGNDKKTVDMEAVIAQTVLACEAMSKERVGALIVFTRDNRLDEQLKTGTVIDAVVSARLLRNIFFPMSPLHDAAVIIRDGKLTGASCVMPLSQRDRVNADLGTRHLAALGISEMTDAVAVVVSEESGTISIAVDGVLKRYLAPQTLERHLRKELCAQQEQKEENPVVRLYQKLQKKGKEEQK